MTTHGRNSEPPAGVARLGVDPWLASIVIALGTAGVALSASARAYEEALSSGMPIGLAQSLLHFAFGLVVMTLAVIPDYRTLTHPYLMWSGLAAVSFLLLLALASEEVNGTHRWVSIGGVSIQPSELAKPILVVAVATALGRAGGRLREWGGLARPLLIGGSLALLVLAGKDLGTPVLLFGVTIVIAFAAGARLRHVAALTGIGLVSFAFFAIIEPYRLKRLAGFLVALRLEPGAIDQVPYQLRQSLLAIGSGGVFGKGFGSSTQKAFFLPEADNDFVYSIIAEELGMLGALAVLGAFLLLAWRGLQVSRRAADDQGRWIALGATWLLAGQALCHMGVVTGLLPTKGLPLPFLSTGGSSLIASFALAGLLLNVSLRGRRHGV